MSPRKKLWLSVASLCLVVILGVTSIAVVLASLTANVNNHFSITYTPRNVNATLASSYTANNSTNVMSSSGVQGIINFDGTETETTKSFDNLGLIEIDEDNPFQINYFIANYGTNVLPINATLSNTPENLRVTYTTSLFNGTQTTEHSETMAANIPTSTLEVPYSGYNNVDDLKAANPEIDQVKSIFDGYLSGGLIGPLSRLTSVRASSGGLGDYVVMSLDYIALNVYCDFLLNGKSTLSETYFGDSLNKSTRDTVLQDFQKLLEQHIPSSVSLSTLPSAFDYITRYAKEYISATLTTDERNIIQGVYGTTLGALQRGTLNYSTIMTNLRDVVMQYFSKYPFYALGVIPDPAYEVPSLTDTTLPTEWQERCLILKAPCLLITIKFEIVDTKLPASFNGGINLNLGSE